MMQDRARLSGFAFVLLICHNLALFSFGKMCVLKDFNCIFAKLEISAERYDVRDDK